MLFKRDERGEGMPGSASPTLPGGAKSESINFTHIRTDIKSGGRDVKGELGISEEGISKEEGCQSSPIVSSSHSS
jgi:hypothetical protein